MHDVIPTEVMQQIFLFTPTTQYMTLALVHHSWNEIFDTNSSIWEYLYERDYAHQKINSSNYKEEYKNMYIRQFTLNTNQMKTSIVKLSDNNKTATTVRAQTATIFLKKYQGLC